LIIIIFNREYTTILITKFIKMQHKETEEVSLCPSLYIYIYNSKLKERMK
jgi:hypothetical protein